MPPGLRDRLDVVDVEGPIPHFAADIQILQKNGEEQSGRRSFRAQ